MDKKKVFCKDCNHSKFFSPGIGCPGPFGWQCLSPHDIDYVHGGPNIVYCSARNPKGNCEFYEAKPAPIRVAGVSFWQRIKAFVYV